MEFEPSSPFTLGMEMEFQLLDSESMDLVYRASPILEKYQGDEHVKPEYQENTIEVTSGIFKDVDGLKDDMTRRIAALVRTSAEFGIKLCGAGTHPFSTRLAIITPSPRYLQMKEDEGYLSRTQVTFATHVHVGLPDGETAVRIMHELKAYLPMFIALAASSPFWRGHDTKFASYRHRILAATRSYGIPPNFSSWDEFCDFFSSMKRAGAYETINDIHWDIRPRPHLGTLEIRAMDVQPTVAEAGALAAFVRAVTLYLERTRQADRPTCMPTPLRWWLEKENHYQASHLGISAQFISNNAGDSRELSVVFADVIREIEGVAVEAGDGRHMARLRAMVETGLSYARQRETYQSTRSFEKVLLELNQKLEREAGIDRPRR